MSAVPSSQDLGDSGPFIFRLYNRPAGLAFLTPYITRVANGQLNLTEATVLYFNFPASVGAPAAGLLARLFSEVLYSIWIKRNTVVFERAKCGPRDIKFLFLYRLRVRIKADFLRLDDVQFQEAWSGVAAEVNGQLVVTV